MKSHADIIRQLGGIRKVAAMLNHTSHTTVQGWSERNNIPMEHWAALVQASSETDAPITASDLLPAELKDAAA